MMRMEGALLCDQLPRAVQGHGHPGAEHSQERCPWISRTSDGNGDLFLLILPWPLQTEERRQGTSIKPREPLQV